MTIAIAIVYHSGYGHTARVADYVAEGAKSVAGTQVAVINVDEMSDAHWATLDAAEGIIFGAPTYMGGVSGEFKMFIDAASKRWQKQAWKDKIAAGFTNSGSYSGDKLNALFQLAVNALQHGMIWVGTGLMPPGNKAMEELPSDQINRFGSSFGLMTQSGNAVPEHATPAGDLETARLFGARVAAITAQFVRGRG